MLGHGHPVHRELEMQFYEHLRPRPLHADLCHHRCGCGVLFPCPSVGFVSRSPPYLYLMPPPQILCEEVVGLRHNSSDECKCGCLYSLLSIPSHFDSHFGSISHSIVGSIFKGQNSRSIKRAALYHILIFLTQCQLEPLPPCR